MESTFIEEIQKRATDLLLELSDNLQIAATDQCSEISRLVGCWILEKYPEFKIHILKGEFPDGSAHDVVAVEDRNILSMIDPTVWQMFPESKSILVGTTYDISGAIDLLHKKYGGKWKTSEIITESNEKYKKELLYTIKNNFLS